MNLILPFCYSLLAFYIQINFTVFLYSPRNLILATDMAQFNTITLTSCHVLISCRFVVDFFLCVGLGLGGTDTPETKMRKSMSNERTFSATGDETLLYKKLGMPIGHISFIYVVTKSILWHSSLPK